MAKLMLQVKDLSVDYGIINPRAILNNLNLDIESEEIVTLLGPSGCGKSTLLNSIAGFNEKVRGEIKIDGKVVQSELSYLPSNQRNLGMVFQDHALFPHLSVYDNIVFALSVKGQKREKSQIDYLIENFKLEGLLNRYPHEISGGQQQRVALARSIAPRPKLLLMDEPFASQDVELKEQVMDALVTVLKANKITALIVTHDHVEAFNISDKMGIMKMEKLEQFDRPHEVYHFPETKFVADFIGHGSFIDGVYCNGTIECDGMMFEKFTCRDKKAQNQSCDTCLSEGETVSLFFRPDEVTIYNKPENGEPDQNSVQGEIVSKKFRGSNYLYGVRIISSNNPVTLLSLTSSLLEQKVGDQVSLKIISREVNFFRKKEV